MIPLGIHLDYSEALYHERERLVASKSALDQVHRSPGHYLAWVNGERSESTPAMRFGSAFHAAVLMPEVFRLEYTTEPDFGDCRKTANKQARDAWRSEHDGRAIISDDDMTTIRGMADAIARHPKASRLLSGGFPEVTLSWDDAETRIRCKGRVDYWRRDIRVAVDLKSTEDASPEAFRRSIAKYRYHVQDAFYRRGFEACKEPVDFFAFVAVEKTAPFGVGVYVLSAESLARGDMAASEDLTTFKQCITSDRWPVYSEEIETIELPAWA